MNLKKEIDLAYNIKTWKPKFSSKIRVSIVDNDYIINQEELGYQLSINKETYFLLISLDGNKTIEEISNNYFYITGDNIEINDLFEFLKYNFLLKGFIESNLKIKSRKNASFLFFKFSIVNKKLINNLYTNQINCIFRRNFFYSSLILVFISNILLYYFFINEKVIIKISYGWIILGLLVSHFIHEWGHVFAAKSFDTKPNQIGFGIYYVFPVFYTDLSDSWNISSRNRIIINLSGIYFEYLIALFCYFLFFFTNNNFFIILATLIFIKTWYNLNPLIQSDMYWVLSDMLKRPNLNTDALNSVNSPIKFIKYFRNLKNNILEIILFGYGIGILCFWIIIIYKFLFVGKSLIRKLPENYIQLTKMIRNNLYELDSLFSILYNLIFIFFILFILFVSLKRLFLFIFQSLLMKEANEKRNLL